MLNKLLLWFTFILLVGCQNSPVKKLESNPELEVKDFRGQTIQLNKPATRVICLIESALSGIYMLGAEDHIIGISSNVYNNPLYKYYSLLDQRVAQKTLAAPGNWDMVSIEQVLTLQPDLVIIWSSQTETIQQLENFNIPVYAVMLKSFDDIIKEITDLGLLLGKSARSKTLTNLTYNELKNINDLHIDHKISSYFAWPQGINHTSGKESTVNDVFEFAGVINCCPLKEEHVSINIEHLLVWDPDMIVMWPNDKLKTEDWEQNQQLQSISAIQNNKIFELPSPFLCDLWTLKIVYTAHIINGWAYEQEDTINISKYRNQLFNKLYQTQIDWPNEIH